MKPIMFNTYLIQGILQGRKIQTRRVIKDVSPIVTIIDRYNKICNWTMWNERRIVKTIKPRYEEKDILWVRETWQDFHNVGDCGIGCEYGCTHGNYAYKATGNFDNEIKWKSSRFIPKEAARIFLEVTDIIVERLWDISEEDVMAEGIEMNNIPHEGWYWMENVYSTDSALLAYERLWDKINGKKYPWESNPWVWAITFKRIEKP